jgi:uncharacterized protein
MRWDEFRQSENVEDRRADETDVAGGFGDSMGGLGGAFSGSRGSGSGLGLGTMVVLGILGYAIGIDPRLLIGGAELLSGATSSHQQSAPMPRRAPSKPSDDTGRFATAILGSTEDVWSEVLPAQAKIQYKKPRMVIFSGATRSGCGSAQSAMGPFYCPLDQTVYIDLSFFDDMQKRFKAGGDFAYAYVIAHEVGHHVENVMGILPKIQARQRQVGQVEANRLSVRVELMADCLAGVWAYHADAKYKALEAGDVEEAMNAAQAIGDDRLQKSSQGRVVPDSFTHGSSEQRMRWFMTGLKGGNVEACNTFQANQI